MSAGSKKTTNRPLESAGFIVCEAGAEAGILRLLCKERGLTEADVEIEDAQGRQHLVAVCGDVFYESGGSALRLMAVIFDSEEDLIQTQRLWADIANNVDSKARLLPFQLPAVDQVGSLETLIRQTIPDASPGAACADQWAVCVQNDINLPESHRKSTQAQRDKAWLQVWLTHRTRDTAYSRIGYAIEKNPSIRQELDPALQRFNIILNEVLNAPLT